MKTTFYEQKTNGGKVFFDYQVSVGDVFIILYRNNWGLHNINNCTILLYILQISFITYIEYQGGVPSTDDNCTTLCRKTKKQDQYTDINMYIHLSLSKNEVSRVSKIG